MKKQLAIFITILSLGTALYGQVPYRKKLRKKSDTTRRVRKSIPKAEKYSPNSHRWPKSDSLKSIESRKIRRLGYQIQHAGVHTEILTHLPNL